MIICFKEQHHFLIESKTAVQLIFYRKYRSQACLDTRSRSLTGFGASSANVQGTWKISTYVMLKEYPFGRHGSSICSSLVVWFCNNMLQDYPEPSFHTYVYLSMKLI